MTATSPDTVLDERAAVGGAALALPPAVVDAGLLLTRVTLGWILIAHGLQKLDFGHDAVTKMFSGMGIPAPGLSAWFATGVELVGGVALVLGLFTPLVAALVTVNLVGAVLFVHRSQGVFADKGGWELAGGLAGFAFLFVLFGAGRLSLDALVMPLLRKRFARG